MPSPVSDVVGGDGVADEQHPPRLRAAIGRSAPGWATPCGAPPAVASGPRTARDVGPGEELGPERLHVLDPLDLAAVAGDAEADVGPVPSASGNDQA